jgi:hypothetical protein
MGCGKNEKKLAYCDLFLLDEQAWNRKESKEGF